jgi:hypothetical protein
MRVFWWQGGLQIQPESPVEAEAMLVLLHGFKYEPPPQSGDGGSRSGSCSARLDEREGGLDVRP